MLRVGELCDALGVDRDEHHLSHHARPALHVAEYALHRPELFEPDDGILGLPLADPEVLRELLVAALQVVRGETLLVSDDVARVFVAHLSGTVPVKDVREDVDRHPET